MSPNRPWMNSQPFTASAAPPEFLSTATISKSTPAIYLDEGAILQQQLDAMFQQWLNAPDLATRRNIVAQIESQLPQHVQNEMHDFTLKEAATILRKAIFPLVRNMNIPPEKVMGMFKAEFERVYRSYRVTLNTEEVGQGDNGMVVDTPEEGAAEALGVTAPYNTTENSEDTSQDNEDKDNAERALAEKKSLLLKLEMEVRELQRRKDGRPTLVVRLPVKGGGGIETYAAYHEARCRNQGKNSSLVRLKYWKEGYLPIRVRKVAADTVKTG